MTAFIGGGPTATQTIRIMKPDWQLASITFVVGAGERMYERTFSTRRTAEREADSFLKEMLEGGWVPHSAAD